MATAEFSKLAGILSAALSQHHLLGYEIAQLELYQIYIIYYGKKTITKMKIMASGPITLWQIEGETMETVTDYFWAS